MGRIGPVFVSALVMFAVTACGGSGSDLSAQFCVALLGRSFYRQHRFSIISDTESLNLTIPS
jgi:hypothetical protein